MDSLRIIRYLANALGRKQPLTEPPSSGRFWPTPAARQELYSGAGTDPKQPVAVWQKPCLASIVVDHKIDKEARMSLAKSVVSIFLLCLSSSISFAQDKPNIVLIFLDNFGLGEPGFNGGELKTNT